MVNSDEALALLRTGLSDEEPTFLWSDVELYSYIDDAQKMFCRLTDGLADASTPAVTLLSVPVASSWLALHVSIKKIRSATLVSTGAPITILNAEDMPLLGLRFDGKSGPLACLVTGMEENKLRCHPVVNVADSIQLSVFRLPLVPLNAAGIPFEVADQHRLHLLDWAKSQAYLKQDSETRDDEKNKRFDAMFRAYCAAAKIEQQEKRHKVRSVVYGGISVTSSPARRY